jgi:hypothetical protein
MGELCAVKGEVAEGQVPPSRDVEPMEEEKEVEESKTASFQIPTYSLVIIFPSNVEHTISAN